MAEWSATRINVANYCEFRYYLRYVLGKQPLRLSAYVKGSLLHGLIENFWEKLGTPEEAAKKSSGKKYFDASSFAKYAKGKWTSITIADNQAEDKIYWGSETEKWFIKSDLEKICLPLFKFLFSEGRPIFSEIGFKFSIGDDIITGWIDEIRKVDDKIILRDYKSGYPYVGEMKLKHDPQLTIYNVGLCSLLKSDKSVAVALGLENKFDDFVDGKYTSSKISEQFFMIEALKKENNPIYQSNRNDQNFLEVLKMMKGVRNSAEQGNVFPEKGKKCDNCDMKVHCDKELKNVGAGQMVDDKGQTFFDFVTPLYIQKEDDKKIVNRKPIEEIQGEKNEIKNIKDPRFHFRYNKDTVTSSGEENCINS